MPATAVFRDNAENLIIAAQHGRVVCFHWQNNDNHDGFFVMPEGLTLTEGFVREAIDNGTVEPTLADIDPAERDNAEAAFLHVLAMVKG